MSAFAKMFGRASSAAGASKSAIGGLDTFTGNVAVASVLGMIGGVYWKNQVFNEERNQQYWDAFEKQNEDDFDNKYLAALKKQGASHDPRNDAMKLAIRLMADKYSVEDEQTPADFAAATNDAIAAKNAPPAPAPAAAPAKAKKAKKPAAAKADKPAAAAH